MDTQPSSQRYQVTSLARGLGILRAVGSAAAPLRNQDLVTLTGLPKATVSRLMNTLCAMGYLRRTDLGSYVPAHRSARAGRAMLEGLDFSRHDAVFRDILGQSRGVASLEARIGNDMVPVYRWTAQGGALAAGLIAEQGGGSPSLACFEHAFGDRALAGDAFLPQLDDGGWCHAWAQEDSALCASVAVQLGALGQFVLALHLPLASRPRDRELEQLGNSLVHAAAAIRRDAARADA